MLSYFNRNVPMKNLSVIVLMLAFAIGAQGQKKGFHLGLKAGVNGNKIEGQSFDQAFNYNYLLGGFVEIPLATRFGLQPEVLFSQGKTTTSSNPSAPFNASDPNNKNVTLDYLN